MFFKKGRGALWVCIWNQGGGGPKKFGNHCSKLNGFDSPWPIVASPQLIPSDTTYNSNSKYATAPAS
jgi:hypothetical protein